MSAHPHTTFIVNPVAGRGKTKHIAEKLSAFLISTDCPHTILTTQYPGHGTELAATASKTSKFVVAVGGDGTMNEVASGLVHTNAVLAVLSEGSGNDFGKLVNAPLKVNEVKNIFTSTIAKFDCGKARITFDDNSIKERYFFNSLGAGFDAAVAKQVSQISWLRGIPLYAAALLKTLAGYTPHRFSVTAKEYNQHNNYFLVCVGNGTWEGGGFKITPDALPNDGLFQVCCVKGKSVPEVLPCLPYALSGKHVTKENVEVFNTQFLTIECEQPFPVHGDGEIFGLNIKKIEIVVLPQCLNVVLMVKR